MVELAVYKQQLADLFKRYKSNNEIYHDLMQFKVREILLVSTIYDAFILEQEEQLTEKVFGEYYQLSLSNAPRITSVPYGETALEILKDRQVDMVILTLGIDEMSPFELSQKIKSINLDIPILLLLNDNTDIGLLRDKQDKLKNFDKVFVWNRDSKIFLAMIKYIEDKINVVKDTQIGMVRVILLVEDSIRYYSKYLPVLYAEIIKQTQRLIAEEHLDEIKKLLRMRTRPKVLMAENYESAVDIFEKYKDYLLCVISDVKYLKDGKVDEFAGIKLIQYIKSQINDLPTLLQSSASENAQEAFALNSSFIDKNSNSLSLDLTNFILNNLGFGDFVFKDNYGNEIAKVKLMEEFETLLKIIPENSLVYHANRNHFSAWLMARGEIGIAKKIQPIKVNDFPNAQELRKYLIDMYKEVYYQKTKGKVINFDESIIGEESYIIRLANGSLGGKGRGLAFVNTLIQNSNLPDFFPNINIKIPKTAIIGTEEFDLFIVNNNLQNIVHQENRFDGIKSQFLNAKLSTELKEKLKIYLKNIKYPLAVRSSSIFEDSLAQPFSGIYQTFLLPNNHERIEIRLKQLTDAIKLVYASVFSKSARSYFSAINYKIEEEKMAIIIQELVGNLYNNRYYPHFSGTAQSYNYYPFSYIKPKDGISTIAVGLGKYVVDGEKAYRFCPKYPKLEILPPEEQAANSQNYFYALDMKQNDLALFAGEEATLVKLDISDAEKDGTLDYCASVWDYENNKIQPGLNYHGPRIINFAYILKYEHIPLSKILDTILEIIKSAMGTPVEIEFGVNLDEDNNKKPSFYILQIKPLIINFEEFDLDINEINKQKLFLCTEKGMGNGKIDDIYDIIYINPEKFDKAKTMEMVLELEKLNDLMKRENRKYILIGPGRWGTRDRWLGIPIIWTQISNAKIIVEAGLKDFQVDPSLGSHFFHNITSMNIGYFTVPYRLKNNFIDWQWLKEQGISNQTEYFIHVHVNKPLTVLMDGRKSISLIYK